MHDRPRRPVQRLEGAPDQVLARLHQHLDGHVRRDLVLLDQPAHEVEIRLAGRRKADLDLLEAQLDQQGPQTPLLRHVHRLQQGLIAVAQIHAGPERRLVMVRSGHWRLRMTVAAVALYLLWSNAFMMSLRIFLCFAWHGWPFTGRIIWQTVRNNIAFLANKSHIYGNIIAINVIYAQLNIS